MWWRWQQTDRKHHLIAVEEVPQKEVVVQADISRQQKSGSGTLLIPENLSGFHLLQGTGACVIADARPLEHRVTGWHSKPKHPKRADADTEEVAVVGPQHGNMLQKRSGGEQSRRSSSGKLSTSNHRICANDESSMATALIW